MVFYFCCDLKGLSGDSCFADGVMEDTTEQSKEKKDQFFIVFFIVSIIKIYPNSFVRFLVSAEGCLQSGGGGRSGGQSGGGGGQSGNKIFFLKPNPA